MNRRLGWAAAALLAASPLLAQSSPADPPRDPRAVEFFALVKRHVQDPRRDRAVDRREDLVAGKRADGSPLLIDLSLPKRADRPAASPHTVVLLLHGGLPDDVPILPRDWQVYRDWGTILAEAGFATVMFDHRLGFPKRHMHMAAAEVATVLDWVDKNAVEYGLATDRVHAVSFSAGGLLVPELARRGRIGRFVLFYPLLGIPPGGPDAQATTADEQAPMAFGNALDALAKRRTPLLVFRAGADAIPGLLPILDAAVTQALARDLDLELVNVPGAPHSFDMTGDPAVVGPLVTRTIEFLR